MNTYTARYHSARKHTSGVAVKQTATRGALLLCTLIFVLLPLAGCGKLFDPGPAMTQVLLNARLPAPVQGTPLPLQLTVSAPTAGNDISTDRIAGLMHGYEVRYLDSAKWTHNVPDLVQRLLADSLEASGGLAGVGTDESGLSPHVRLTTDIKRFYLRYDGEGKAPVAEVSLSLRLTDLRNGLMLGNTSISATQQSAGETPQELVAAFSIATSKVLAKNTEWVLDVLGKTQK